MCPPGRYLSCPLPVSSSSSWNLPPLPWQLVLPQPPDLPASGTYLLPLMILVETKSKSSKTHLWSQNLKREVRGSEIYGHFQMHDKFKASLGHMRYCLKKKKRLQNEFLGYDFRSLGQVLWARESSQSFRLVISLTEESRVEWWNRRCFGRNRNKASVPEEWKHILKCHTLFWVWAVL